MISPSVRQVSFPLKKDDLSPLDPGVRVVQTNSRLSDNDFRRLAAFLEQYPEVGFRVYGGYDRPFEDLEFLRFFPNLRRFSVDALYRLPSLDGLRHLSPQLEALTIGATKSKRFSLKALEAFPRLRTLCLEGQQKDIESLGALTELVDLTLKSITLPDLSSLLPLGKLRSLDIKLGGTANLNLLPRVGRLEYLELWMVRGLDDVSPIAEVQTLERFLLQALRQVTSLPSFRSSRSLRHATLDTMKGLTDLRPLAAAPNLERLELIAMNHLQPEALRPLVGHPTLREGVWGLGSDRKNQAAWKLLPLGPRPLTWAEYKEKYPPAKG